MQNKK
jgi:hypothetical protein